MGRLFSIKSHLFKWLLKVEFSHQVMGSNLTFFNKTGFKEMMGLFWPNDEPFSGGTHLVFSNWWTGNLRSALCRWYVLLASSDSSPVSPHTLWWFTAECEAIGMRIGSLTMNCTLQVGNKFLPQVNELKYLRVLLKSEGKTQYEINRQIDTVSPIMWPLTQQLWWRGISAGRQSFQSACWSVMSKSKVFASHHLWPLADHWHHAVKWFSSIGWLGAPVETGQGA